MHQTIFYFEHQDIIILAYKKAVKIAQATFNIWISIVFMSFFVNYVDPLPRVIYLFFFFLRGGGLEPRNDVLLTFKGIITHTSQCMVFSSRRPCFGRICTTSILNQSDTKQKRYGQLVTQVFLSLRLRRKCTTTLPSAQRHPL